MKNETYIVCNKVKATDTDGYLFLLGKGSAKNRLKKALGIKVNYTHFKDFWNKTEQRFMSGMKDYKKLNDDIQKSLSDTKIVIEKETEKKEIQVSKDNNSFLEYWQGLLNLITVVGTRAKYQQQKIKFEKYLTSLKKTDIFFSEITPAFIKQYQHYLKTTKDPKLLHPNQVNHYLKTVNNFINKKIGDDPFTYTIHPFTGIKYDEKKDSVRRVLQSVEFDKVIFSVIKDKELALTRDMFLFMVFCGGMRLGDLLLLRWNTFVSNYVPTKNDSTFSSDINYDLEIDYVQSKRLKEKKTELSFYACKILMTLSGAFNLDILNNYIYNTLTNPKKYKILGKKLMTIEDIADYIETQCTTNAKGIDYITYKGYTFKRDNEELKLWINCLEEEKKDRMEGAVNLTAPIIYAHIMSNKCANKFVFPILNNEDFEGLPNADYEFKRAVTQSEHLTGLLYNGEKQFVTRMKTLSTFLGVKKINPHSARHTTTQKMITEGENVFTIQQNLGHKSSATTEKYTKGKDFKIKDRDSAMKKIGNKSEYL